MMKEIFIETDFIKLDSLLKFAELVDSGGFAKILVVEGYVKLNGVECTERGKKIRNGDIVEVEMPDDDGNIEEVITLKILKKV